MSNPYHATCGRCGKDGPFGDGWQVVSPGAVHYCCPDCKTPLQEARADLLALAKLVMEWDLLHDNYTDAVTCRDWNGCEVIQGEIDRSREAMIAKAREVVVGGH